MRQDTHENKMRQIALVYIGEGIVITGIPARDLTAQEAEKFGGMAELLQTGLYATPEEIKFDGG